MVINLYNETNAFNAHTQLQSSPVTIDVDPVGISIPTGVIRLEYDKPITHIKFNYSGVDYICKITAVTNMGGTLNEYNYSIDYLKDYCNKYGLEGQDIVVSRSTSADLWRKYVVDNDFPRNNKYDKQLFVGALVDMSVMIVVNYYDYSTGNDGCDTYFVPMNKWESVQKNLMNPKAKNPNLPEAQQKEFEISSDYVVNAVRGVYIVPTPMSDDFQNLELVDYIYTYYKVDYSEGIRAERVKITLDEKIHRLRKCNNYNGITVRVGGFDLDDLPVNDWTDLELTKYIVYAPLYGSFEVDLQKFEIPFYYHISPSMGSISISTFQNDITTMLPPQRLPSIPLMIDSTISSQRIINNETALTVGAGVAATVATLGVSAVSGGALAPLAAFGAIQTAGGAVVSAQKSKYALAEKGIEYSQYTGSFGTHCNKTQLLKIKMTTPITMGEFASRYGYYCDYKIGDTMPDSLHGKRCWLDLHGARIRGADWYAANVRNALDGICIIID